VARGKEGHKANRAPDTRFRDWNQKTAEHLSLPQEHPHFPISRRTPRAPQSLTANSNLRRTS